MSDTGAGRRTLQQHSCACGGRARGSTGEAARIADGRSGQHQRRGVTQNNAQIAFEALLENLRKEAKIKYGAAAQAQ
ncbi:hypothetical protein CRX72_10800 [Pantoea sp. BRM17]|nr:hypothetical protein CRX72_10800 [Pantoea sp. BRM17]